MKAYKSRQEIWERKSSIRSRPRRILDRNNILNFYPLNRQALCLHPEVKQLGDKAIRFILTQSAYKFMGDIASVETHVICRLANKIAHQWTPYQFPVTLQQDMLCIIIDETYHAYVAKDFMSQVAEYTEIQPITLEYETGLYAAIKSLQQQLPQKLCDGFEIVAVAIGENSVTKSLISVAEEDEVHSLFSEVNADHMIDEGRHAGIFSDLIQLYWQQESDANKAIVGPLLPHFIREYLKHDKQKAYDAAVLRALGLHENIIEKIINDTYLNYTLENFKNVNPIVKQIIAFLETAKLFEHEPTYSAFKRDFLID